jgi:colicin import membrane protein
MQISKSLLIGCATALLLSPLSLRADDTEAQAKAREALNRKMEEMQTRPPGMPVAPEPVVKPSQAEQQKQAEQAKADKAAAEKAKKEEQRKAEQAAKEAKKPAPTAAQPTEFVQPNEPAQTTVTAQTAAQPTAGETAAPAVEGKPADQTKKSDKSSKKSEPATKKPDEAKAKKPDAFQPLQGPPSPLSADKQQRLSELNRKYLADQITSVEYHAERAKIIAEP